MYPDVTEFKQAFSDVTRAKILSRKEYKVYQAIRQQRVKNNCQNKLS